jgi:hypothetical protein
MVGPGGFADAAMETPITEEQHFDRLPVPEYEFTVAEGRQNIEQPALVRVRFALPRPS